MNNKNENIEELLDQIVIGKFSEEEISKLVQPESQEDFFGELILHRAAASVIQRHTVIGQVKTVHNEYLKRYRKANSEEAPVHTLPGRKILHAFIAVAAAFIVACSLIVLYWYNASTGDKLFAERYQAYRVNVARSDDAVNSLIVRDYQQEHFREAIAEHEKNPAVDLRDKMVVAGAYLELHRYDDASAIFKDIIAQKSASGNQLYHDEAEYYLALTFLKQKQYDKAYQLFNTIYRDKEHTFNIEVNWWFLTRIKWLE